MAIFLAQANAQQLQPQGRDDGEVSVARAHEQVSVSPMSFSPCPVLSWELSLSLGRVMVLAS